MSTKGPVDASPRLTSGTAVGLSGLLGTCSVESTTVATAALGAVLTGGVGETLLS